MIKFLLLVLLLNSLSFAEEIAKVVYEVTKNSKYPIAGYFAPYHFNDDAKSNWTFTFANGLGTYQLLGDTQNGIGVFGWIKRDVKPNLPMYYMVNYKQDPFGWILFNVDDNDNCKDIYKLAGQDSKTKSFSYDIDQDGKIDNLSNYLKCKIINNNVYFSVENENSIIFKVKVPPETPKDEFVCLKFYSPYGPFKMSKIDEDLWTIKLPIDKIPATEYKYCRNCEDGAADEYFDNIEIGWRKFDPTPNTILEDSVKKWRWWNKELISLTIDTSKYINTKPDYLKKRDFFSGVMFPDWWKHDWLPAIPSTLNKVKIETGAKWIEFSPIPEITQLYPLPKIDRNGNNGISDEDLIKIIDEIHKKGYKIFLNPYPWYLGGEDDSPQNHSQEWWDAFVSEWGKELLHYAKIAQEHNVEMFGFRMWMNLEDVNKDEALKINDGALDIFNKVKTIYKGIISTQVTVNTLFDDQKEFLDVQKRSDLFNIEVWSYYPWILTNSKDDSVDDIATNFENNIKNYLVPLYEKFHKSIIIDQLSIQSFDGSALSGGGVEEYIAPFYKDNSDYKLDLQEQADIYEAIFQNIAKFDFIKGAFIFTYNYWSSIDKDINLRGKPSAKVVKKWFDWLSQ